VAKKIWKSKEGESPKKEFCIDPETKAVIDAYPALALVPLEDEDAYNEFRQFNWVYDKYTLLTRFEQEVYLNALPKSDLHTVYCARPRRNMDGLSRGMFYTHGNVPDLKGLYKEDYIITPAVFYSITNSLDCLIENGRIVDFILFKGYLLGGDYYKWMECETDMIPPKIPSFLRRHLNTYSGMINVEYTHSNQIIEMHLRPSLQNAFVDGGLIARWGKSDNPVPCGWIKIIREPTIFNPEEYEDEAEAVVAVDLSDDEQNARNRRLGLVSYAY